MLEWSEDPVPKHIVVTENQYGDEGDENNDAPGLLHNLTARRPRDLSSFSIYFLKESDCALDLLTERAFTLFLFVVLLGL